LPGLNYTVLLRVDISIYPVGSELPFLFTLKMPVYGLSAKEGILLLKLSPEKIIFTGLKVKFYSGYKPILIPLIIGLNLTKINDQ